MSTYKGFNVVELRKPKKSMFDLSHEKKMTLRMGKLVPILCMECIPGDSVSYNPQVFMRLLALLAPIYGMINVTVHCFAVAHRLLWAEWEDFITTGRLGADVGGSAPLPPVWPLGGSGGILTAGLDAMESGELLDYLGVPSVPDSEAANYAAVDATIDIMPILGYNLVFIEYYRDRNFTNDDQLDQYPFPSGVQNFDETLGFLRTRHWGPDYFTTALPFTQRGAEVLIPMGGVGDVTYLAQSEVAGAGASVTDVFLGSVGDGNLSVNKGIVNGGTVDYNAVGESAIRIENIDEINFENTTITVNDLRQAVRLQEWFERNAIAGNRYTENIQAHFGLKPQDYRMQRPEYIGGFKMPIKISEVVNTAFSLNEADETIPAGNLAGHGIGRGGGRVHYFAQEHCFIYAIMSIMTVPTYMQGLPRMFRRKTFLDYPWPAFALLGEQEVKKYEIFMNPANMDVNAEGEEPLFGYQSRYADWKYIPSTSHGDFKNTLLFWTLTRNFATSPTLGNTFLQMEDALQDRIFAVSGNNFLAYVYNRISVVRALPYFSRPTI